MRLSPTAENRTIFVIGSGSGGRGIEEGAARLDGASGGKALSEAMVLEERGGALAESARLAGAQADSIAKIAAKVRERRTGRAKSPGLCLFVFFLVISAFLH
jgi:hypothetical protein